MNVKLNSAVLAWSVLAGLGFFSVMRAQQQTATGRANNFTSVDYYPAPHQRTMKSRLSGAEAQPQGERLVIKELKLEKFDTNGILEVIIQAPHCVYDTKSGAANSPGHLRLETADGKSHVEGDGFLWQQTNQFLTISNNVRTVIERASETKGGL